MEKIPDCGVGCSIMHAKFSPVPIFLGVVFKKGMKAKKKKSQKLNSEILKS